MKIALSGIAALAITLFSASAYSQSKEDIQALYQEGRAAFHAGQLEVAQEKLSKVLQRNPSHLETQAMLAQIKVARGNVDNTLMNTYQKVMLPKIEFNDVSLTEALQALRIHARNASDQKISPNVIVKNPELGEKKVSLNLTNVPLTEVLSYLAQMAGGALKYEKNAVLITNPG